MSKRTAKRQRAWDETPRPSFNGLFDIIDSLPPRPRDPLLVKEDYRYLEVEAYLDSLMDRPLVLTGEGASHIFRPSFNWPEELKLDAIEADEVQATLRTRIPSGWSAKPEGFLSFAVIPRPKYIIGIDSQHDFL